MPSTSSEKRFLAESRMGETRESESNTNSSQTMTVSAPGAGKALVILGATAWYSDGSAHDVTVDYTDRSGTARSQTMRTGGAPQSDAALPFPSGESPVLTEGNSAVSISAPAAGTADETSTVRLHFAVVDEGTLADVESFIG